MQEREIEQLVGERVGSYAVDTLLGHGKINALYQAHHVARDLSVMLTLFLLPPTFSAQERALFKQRFSHESEALLKLSHPHIFPLYDYGEYLGLPYHVSPFHEGTSLSRILRKQGGLPTKRALSILRQVAEALDYACDRGMVHGYLSSSNILLDEHDAVQVAGFDLTRMLTLRGIAQSSNLPHTHLLNIAGVFLGSPAYMAPEVVLGQVVNRRTDVYALGILLFETLHGTPPFTGENPAIVLQQHFQQRVPSLPTLSVDVDSVIRKALQRQPEQRFQSAGELVDAFALAIGAAASSSHALPSPAFQEAVLPPAHSQPDIARATTLLPPEIQQGQQGSEKSRQNPMHTLPPTVNWLRDEMDATVQQDSAATASPSPAPFPSSLTPDSLSGIDPFDWWSVTSQTKAQPSGKTTQEQSSGKRGPLRKRSRRQVVALFATGGVLVIGAAGASSLLLPRLLQQHKTQPNIAHVEPIRPALQPQPTSRPTPTPTPQPTAAPTPQPTPTPAPQPTAAPQPAPTPIPQPQHTGTVIASTGMPVNTARTFTNPANGNGSILVHLSGGNFVAYDRACTHEGVPVNYNADSHQLVCPAHDATFDPANGGSVTQGPADNPLPRVAIRVNNDGTVTVG